MKKEIAALLAAGMLLAVTSCDKAPEESQTETQTETTAFLRHNLRGRRYRRCGICDKGLVTAVLV